MTLWLEVTPDQYSLPVKVCDSVHELAEACGVSANTIYSTISHFKAGRHKTCKFEKVVIEDNIGD